MRVVDIIEKTCVLKERPAVACIEWIEPLMTAGNWEPELASKESEDYYTQHRYIAENIGRFKYI